MPDIVPRPDSEATIRLLDLVREGNEQAVNEILTQHREGLRAFIALHFDPGLRGRFDPSDVVNETQLEIVRRFPDYLKRSPMPFHLWARKTAHQRLLNMVRYHRSQIRDPRLELRSPDSSSVALTGRLVGSGTSPSEAAEARERADRVTQAIEMLDDDEREILLFRHVDEMPHEEIAAVLGVSSDASRQRYGRALERLERKLCALGVSGPVT